MLPLVVLDELVVGQALIVPFGALLVQLRLLALSMRLLLGDPCTLLGRTGALLANLSLLPMLGRYMPAALA